MALNDDFLSFKKFPYSVESVLSSHPAIPAGERLIQVLEPANCRGNVTKCYGGRGGWREEEVSSMH